MDEGDRKEWVWQDHTKENLLCVRKMRYQDLTCSYASSSDVYSDDDEEDAHEGSASESEDGESKKPLVRVYRRNSSFGSSDRSDNEGQKPANTTVGHNNLTMDESRGLIDTSIRTDSDAYAPG